MIFTSDFDDDSNLIRLIKSKLSLQEKNNETKKKLKLRSIKSRYKPLSEDERNANISSHPGDVLIDRINEWLNKLYRSPCQVDFHNYFIMSCLRVIYKDDYMKERHRVCAKYGFNSRKQQTIICSGRRTGKTFSVSFFVVVMCVLISDIEISIFSPGKRQSVALMGHICTFLDKLGETDRIMRRNEEKLILLSMNGRESKINAYPSAVKTLKGVSGTIIILEEMAQIDPDVLYEVVVPLHQLDITSVIGISTITTEDNFMTKYLEQKDAHGEPLFSVQHVHLVCKACRDKGIAAKCTHNSFMLPAWSSARKRKVINSIMAEHEDILNREIGGIANSLHKKAFPKKMLDLFYNLQRQSLSYHDSYDHFFVGIDPNGAGANSDFAIISIVRFNGMNIILGMEAFETQKASDNHALIVSHIEKIRSDERFSNSKAIIIVENNMGLEASHIANMLEVNISNYLLMDEKDNSTHRGFRTTNQMKTMAVENIRERILENSLRIVSDNIFVCLSSSKTKVLEKFWRQIHDFAEVVKEYETKKPKKFYSGKKSGKDDLVLALMLTVHWSGFYYKSPKYSHFH